jgi:hypothetical protein
VQRLDRRTAAAANCFDLQVFSDWLQVKIEYPSGYWRDFL